MMVGKRNDLCLLFVRSLYTNGATIAGQVGGPQTFSSERTGPLRDQTFVRSGTTVPGALIVAAQYSAHA
ncbi:MAG: hypothetical protein WB005_10520, partial [Pseudolabrys sp.]